MQTNGLSVTTTETPTTPKLNGTSATNAAATPPSRETVDDAANTAPLHRPGFQSHHPGFHIAANQVNGDQNSQRPLERYAEGPTKEDPWSPYSQKTGDA
jgi:hypothetical protein